MGHTRGVSSPPPTPANHPSAGPPAPRSGTSAGQVLGAIAAFLVLAAVGATLGWTLTDVPPAAAAPPASSSSSSPAGPSASPEPQPTQAPPSTPATTPGNNGSGIPDYAAAGTLFTAARDELRGRGVAVVLIFASSGNAQTVNRTDPPAGSPVSRGMTVKIYVNGVAPPLGVPPIPNNTKCSDWGRQLVSIGFLIAGYHGGRSKPVTAESPDQNNPNTVWNQQITLTCGDDNPQPSSSPSTPDTNPPGGSPSPSAGP
jgi:PASTA domain